MSKILWIYGPHVFHCVTLFIWIFFFAYYTGGLDSFLETSTYSRVEYGTLLTYILIGIRLLSFTALPQTLCTLTGLVRFNAFPGSVSLKNSPLGAPFICVRVVTRGLYPKLVQNTVKKNLETLNSVGLENFIIQVVTDSSVDLPENPKIREVVVPPGYIPKSKALNKARALQYCLENDINTLEDDNWIVHLDEETLLTEDSVKGILNFVEDGKSDFGQGLVTYARDPIKFKDIWTHLQNRICTIADSFRVSDDMGKLRCQLKIFGRPLFGWKGSYVVSRARAERMVGFDNGPEGSKAEDCYFGILAMDQGYTFDFIEGEMREKSPFTFVDFFHQRKRWMQGIYLVVASSKISLRSRLVLGLSLLSWLTMPISASNLILSRVYPMSVSPLVDFILAFLGAMGLYMYFYGFVKQHPIQRFSWIRLVLSVPEIFIASAVSIIAENIAIVSMWWGDWYGFYIVQKEVEEDLKFLEKDPSIV